MYDLLQRCLQRHLIPFNTHELIKKKNKLKKCPGFMPDNEIMFTFQKFLSSLNWLEFQFIWALKVQNKVCCIGQMVRQETLNYQHF